MPEYVQVGSTMARDPITRECLHDVPLYIRAGSAPADQAAALGETFRQMMQSCNPFREYMAKMQGGICNDNQRDKPDGHHDGVAGKPVA